MEKNEFQGREKLFGLIGYPIGHSFSKQYFTWKFENEDLKGHTYELFPMENLENFRDFVFSKKNLVGLNVTIPHKETVIRFLDEVRDEAAFIQAVNVVKIENGKLCGYNTDVYGFEYSLKALLKKAEMQPASALVLGQGGAAKAVQYVLKKMRIIVTTVSRHLNKGDIIYEELEARHISENLLVINCTPVGMYPNTEVAPNIPYEFLTSRHLLFDLVYNPEKTLFLRLGESKGCLVKGGLEMLYKQAEKAWDIWKK